MEKPEIKRDIKFYASEDFNPTTAREIEVADEVEYIKYCVGKKEEAIDAYEAETDPDFKESHMEDAYLHYLKSITHSKGLGEEEFVNRGLDKFMGCKYDELILEDFESYKEIFN